MIWADNFERWPARGFWPQKYFWQNHKSCSRQQGSSSRQQDWAGAGVGGLRGVSIHESHWKSTSGGGNRERWQCSRAAAWRAVKFRFTFEIVAKWKSLSRMPQCRRIICHCHCHWLLWLRLWLWLCSAFGIAGNPQLMAVNARIWHAEWQSRHHKWRRSQILMWLPRNPDSPTQYTLYSLVSLRWATIIVV